MKFSEKIKQLRNKAGLTQPELAKRSDIEQSYLSKLENDKGSPSFDVISKIAVALNTDAMTLIESLDLQYIHDHLSHLPEIAIKATEMRMARFQQMKKHYIQASLLIIFGIACVVMGGTQSLFPNKIYEYYSVGIIKTEEPLQQFDTKPIELINENWDKAVKRIEENRSRIDEKYLSLDKYMGEHFTQPVGTNRRHYQLKKTEIHSSPNNGFIIVFGVILIVGGGFLMNFVYQFKEE